MALVGITGVHAAAVAPKTVVAKLSVLFRTHASPSCRGQRLADAFNDPTYVGPTVGGPDWLPRSGWANAVNAPLASDSMAARATGPRRKPDALRRSAAIVASRPRRASVRAKERRQCRRLFRRSEVNGDA